MFRMMVPFVAAACLLAVQTPTLSAAQSKPASRTTTAKPAAGKVVNINTASVAELNGLPGIGAKTAALIGLIVVGLSLGWQVSSAARADSTLA